MVRSGAALQQGAQGTPSESATHCCSPLLLPAALPVRCAPQKEASEVFFAATKLFQARDPHLRRMVYLCIKDICPGSDEVRRGWRACAHLSAGCAAYVCAAAGRRRPRPVTAVSGRAR